MWQHSTVQHSTVQHYTTWVCSRALDMRTKPHPGLWHRCRWERSRSQHNAAGPRPSHLFIPSAGRISLVAVYPTSLRAAKPRHTHTHTHSQTLIHTHVPQHSHTTSPAYTSAFTHTHTHTGLPQLVSPSVPLPYSTNCTMCVGNTSEGHPAYTSLTRQQGGTRQPQHVSDMSLILIRIAKYRPHLPALSLLWQCQILQQPSLYPFGNWKR